MARRPLRFPQWTTNTDGSANDVGDANRCVEPSPDKKLIGWNNGEAPSRNIMNDLHRLYDQWIRYFAEDDFNDNNIAVMAGTINTVGGTSTHELPLGFTIQNSHLISLKIKQSDESYFNVPYSHSAVTVYTSFYLALGKHVLQIWSEGTALTGQTFTAIIKKI